MLHRIVLAAVLTLASVLTASVARANGAPPAYGTITMDVVALAGGTEVQGEVTRFVNHEGYRYLFASDENAAKFSADPAAFEVGMDGMCASMGPLAGRGSTEIVAIHKGRIYLCASDSCKADFLSAPDKHIDRDDPVPTIDRKGEAAARALLARAASAHAGVDGLEPVKLLREVFEEDVKQGDTVYHHTAMLTLGVDGSVRTDDTWGETTYSTVATPEAAWTQATGEPAEPMYTDARRELERRVRDTHWLTVLRNANAPGAIVVPLGTAKLLGGTEAVERVVVSRDGITCVLGIDPISSRVRCIDFTSRGKGHLFDVRTRVFEGYQNVDGILVPTAWTDWVSGQQIGARTGLVVLTNDQVTGDPFAVPPH